MAEASIVYTTQDAMITCGVNVILLLEGKPLVERLAINIFDDTLITCIGKTFDDISAEFETYSSLTQFQGQICLL